MSALVKAGTMSALVKAGTTRVPDGELQRIEFPAALLWDAMTG
jgi:hypothetical protein